MKKPRLRTSHHKPLLNVCSKGGANDCACGFCSKKRDSSVREKKATIVQVAENWALSYGTEEQNKHEDKLFNSVMDLIACRPK